MERFSKVFWVLFFLAVSFSNVFAKGSVVGVIVNGFDKTCKIIHNNKTFDCVEHRELYVGDIIEKKPSINELELKLEPYVTLKHINSDKVKIIYKNISKDINMIERTKGFIKGFLKPVKLTYFFAATRGDETVVERERCIHILKKELDKPGPYSTVLYDSTVEFVWEYDFSAIVFENLNGEDIFRKNIKDVYSVRLSPEEMGLKRNKMYIWYYEYEGAPLEERYKMKLLDRQTERNVLNTLKEIDKQNIKSIEKTVQKSAYLQLVSDINENIDLFWLSYQVLPKNVGILNEEEKSLICKLKFRYIKYLENLSM